MYTVVTFLLYFRVQVNFLEMSIVDESHLSQRAEETTFYHSENITFSKNFLENLIQASDDLLNRSSSSIWINRR